jgi:hypothetical protein
MPEDYFDTPEAAHVASRLDLMLTQADIFAEIFRRETIRFKYGSKNQLREASTRLRGCLDKIDALMGKNILASSSPLSHNDTDRAADGEGASDEDGDPPRKGSSAPRIRGVR